MEAEQRRARDLATENRKLQRLLQEQKQQTEDERRLAAEANEQISQLQVRIKTLKRQLEEAVMMYFETNLILCNKHCNTVYPIQRVCECMAHWRIRLRGQNPTEASVLRL